MVGEMQVCGCVSGQLRPEQAAHEKRGQERVLGQCCPPLDVEVTRGPDSDGKGLVRTCCYHMS